MLKKRRLKQAWTALNWAEIASKTDRNEPRQEQRKRRGTKKRRAAKKNTTDLEVEKTMEEIPELDKLLADTAPNKPTTEDKEINETMEAINKLEQIMMQTDPSNQLGTQSDFVARLTSAGHASTHIDAAHSRTLGAPSAAVELETTLDTPNLKRPRVSPSPPMGMREPHIPPSPSGAGVGSGNQEGSPNKSMGQKRSLAALLGRRASRRQARAVARRLFRSHGKVLPELVSQEDSYQDTQDGHTQQQDDRLAEHIANLGMIEAEEIWGQQRDKKFNALKIATFNAKGASHLSGREKFVHMMIKNERDVMMMQEMKVNTSSKGKHEDYTFLFSTGITDKQRAEAEQKREETRRKKQKHAGEEEQENHRK